MLRLIRSMIKRGLVTLNPADMGQYPVVQVRWSSNDTANNVHVITPYGYYSVAPVGALATMFNVMGQEENRLAIVDDPKGRFKGLKPGEAVVGSPKTGSKVHFKENGDIEVTGKANQNINITGDVNLTVGGNVNIIVTGNSTITTTGDSTVNTTGNILVDTTGNTTINTGGNTKIDTTGTTTIDSTGNMSSTIGGTLVANVTGNTTITSPIVKVNGALNVTGEITAFSGLANEINFTDVETKYNNHKHTEFDVGGLTSVPNNTLP